MIDSASRTSAQGGLIGRGLFSQNRQRRRLDSSLNFPLRETDILGYKVTNEAQIGADSRLAEIAAGGRVKWSSSPLEKPLNFLAARNSKLVRSERATESSSCTFTDR